MEILVPHSHCIEDRVLESLGTHVIELDVVVSDVRPDGILPRYRAPRHGTETAAATAATAATATAAATEGFPATDSAVCVLKGFEILIRIAVEFVQCGEVSRFIRINDPAFRR